MLDKLTIIEKFILDNEASLDPIKMKESRKQCIQTQYKVMIGTTCMITSGNASEIVGLNDANQLESVYTNPDTAGKIAINCIQFVISSCLVEMSKNIFFEIIGKTITD